MKKNNIEAIYSLSPMQEGMLFSAISRGGGAGYVLPLRFELRGQLNTAALRQSWQQVIDRHTILRTGFYWEGKDQPVQVVYKTSSPKWTEMDWRDISRLDQQSRLKRLLREEKERGFDLKKAPLMRMTLVQLGEEEYEFIWSLHHILMDGWSRPIVLKEVFAYYEAWRKGDNLRLEASRLYSDYIGWIRGRSKEKAERYWSELLKGFDTPTRLMAETNGKRWQINEVENEYEYLSVSEKVTKRLNEVSRRHQITLNTIVQCGWGILLSRYSGESDVVFGIVVSGRSADIAGIEKMVGIFINTLPVRIEVRLEETVKELLRRIQDQQVVSREYEYSHLVDVQKWSDVGREERLFDTIVSFQNFPIDNELKKHARSSEIASVERIGEAEDTEYGISLAVTARNTITFRLGYDPSRYEQTIIKRVLEGLRRILESIAADIDQRVSQIEILSNQERAQILYEWNDTQVAWPGENCVHELFEEQAERTPDAIAVVYEGEQISYRALNRKANQLGHYLRTMGVGPEVLVGVCLERSIEMVVGLIGVWKAGAVYVAMDPSYPEQRLRWMMEDAAVAVALTSGAAREALGADQVRVIDLEDEWREVEKCGEENPRSGVSGDNLAYVIYTSGSTGEPKGVMVAHGNLTNVLKGSHRNFHFGAGEEMLCLASFSFDISLFELMNPIVTGGKVNILSRERVLNMGRLLDELKKAGVIHAVPTLMRQIIEGIKQGPANKQDYGNVEKVFVGGESVPPDLLREMGAIFKAARIEALYGPTEGTIICASERVEPSEVRGRNPIGKPLDNVRIELGERNSQFAPIGVPGELWIGGAGVARGYLKRPELTAERFIPESGGLESGARMYRTGDLARWLKDGRLEYLGRTDQQVKVRGYRIELGEIEARLAEHAAVAQAAAVAREEAGEKRLVAYVVTKDGEESRVGELREYLKERLPDYMAPWAYVRLERLPLTANGKVDKKALPQPEMAGGEPDESYRKPRTEVEEVMAGIWRRVLGVERVGAEGNFFELGGHSLLATRAVSKVREVFKVELPLRTIFEEKTLAGLSRRVEAELRAGAGLQTPPIERAPRGESLPLSFAQQRLWFIDQLEPGGAMYNIPSALRVRGELRRESLESALGEVVRRHEVLRTRFEIRGGQPVQIIDRAGPVAASVIDVSWLEERQREKEARRIAGEEAARGFDLGRGPLLRAGILRLGEQDQALLFTMHHIVSDEWSSGVLTNEVSRLYEAYGRGEASPLEELPIQYADYAVWQREWLRGEALDRQVSYWREHLDGVEALELPTDYRRPVTQSYEGADEVVLIPAETLDRLRELGRREGVTMFMLLMSAFKILLHRYSGQEQIVVGTPIAGRNRLELEPLIGFFVNMLAIKTDLAGGPSVREAIGREREAALGAYAHQDVPFEKIVEELQPERDLSRHPIFLVTFVYEKATEQRVAAENLRLSEFGTELNQAKYDLGLSVVEGARGLAAAVVYCRALFDGVRARRMLWHLRMLLEGMAEDADRKIGQIEILSESERAQILSEWNDTQVAYPGEKRVHELFAEQAERSPEQIALIDERKQVSYGELNRRANQLGHYLQRLGVGPEVVVGLCLERSVEMVVGIMGALKAGGAYLPLDLESPLERFALMLEDAGVGVLLTEKKLEKRPPSFWGPSIYLDEELERISEESERDPENGVEGENLAYVIYTSGSTGRPKGVMINHGGLFNYLRWATEAYGVKEGEGAPVQSSIGFDLTVTSLYGPLVNGKRVKLLPEEEGIEALAKALSMESGYSLVKITPGHLDVLAQQMRDAEVDGRTRVLVIGGEELKAGGLRFWQERAGGTRLINEYGPTETVVGCCIYEVEEEAAGKETIPIGKPIANARIYILDKGMEPTPIGTRGEIYISGTGLARGYLGKPDLTAERFIPNHFSQKGGERLYRTGDVGRYLSDGKIEFIGRADEQVKIRGYRIELGEIEAVLCEHPRIRQSAVVIREDEHGLKNLVAYVESKDWRNPPPGAYVLPNGIAIAQQNKNETEFLYEEIFERQQYLRYGIEMRAGGCVFDVGANIGLFTLFIEEHCPNARIYAFEPIEDIHRCLKQNVARYEGRVKAFNYGLSDDEKEVIFTYYPRYSMMSRQKGHSSEEEDKELVKRYLKNEQERGVTGSEELLAQVDELLEGRFEGLERNCRLRRLSDVMKEEGIDRIDLLKIDAERSEEEVLAGIEDEDWEKIDQIVMEAHDENVGGRRGRVQEIIGKLESLGYVVEKEEDKHLRGTGLYNLYARRVGPVSVEKSGMATSRREADVVKVGLSTAELREYLQQRLPEYMAPGVYVRLERLPLTANGKVDKKALPQPDEAGREL